MEGAAGRDETQAPPCFPSHWLGSQPQIALGLGRQPLPRQDLFTAMVLPALSPPRQEGVLGCELSVNNRVLLVPL